MRIVGIIPARMESSRFPGKPMKELLGMPMIGHVLRRSELSKSMDAVYVATCNQEIFDYVESIGGKALMTKNTHERCTERTEEALTILEARGEAYDIVVMIQGDEPMIAPEMIDEVIEPFLHDPSILAANLLGRIESESEFLSPNSIKVVVNNKNDALYFSRNPIPSLAKYKGEADFFKQVCVIPFRASFLHKFVQWPESTLEKIESVDMLRILENGENVRMVPTRFNTHAVDTEADLAHVASLLKTDGLVSRYLSVRV